MCSLVFGLDVLGDGSVILATNRDEDPARGSEGPQVLRREQLVVGGRDVIAGGTWLALRASRAGKEVGVAMLLNRFDPSPGAPGRRSRGLLTLDVAAAPDPRAAALAEAATGRYAPCSLVWLSPAESWLLAIRHGEAPSLEPIVAGWHALAHFELDDPVDPRTSWLASRLAGFAPKSREKAEAGLHTLVTFHGSDEAPAVCLHEGRAPTVSSARLWIAPGEVRYQHAAGRPCVTEFQGWTSLLTGSGAGR